MTNENVSKLNKLRKVFRANMLVGLSIVMIAVYFIITGSYENIRAREATETTLSWLGLGGLLYLVSFGYMCVFKNHLFFKQKSE